MERSTKIGYAVSAALFALAAFFSITLIIYILDFGAYSPAHKTFFYAVGSMLAGAYGFCSVLIPAFFFISALICMSSRWTRQKAMMLLTAVVPFFTAVITENICRAILENASKDFMMIKICTTLAVGILLIIVEIIGACFFADLTANNPRIFRKEE
ncbi:MAG: cell division protein FtsK, partial [Treponema sp.]|nr:cell division protein FtsK [Treponema sp.]